MSPRTAPVSFAGEARTDDVEGEKRLEQSYASPGTASPVSSKVRMESQEPCAVVLMACFAE